MLKVSGVTKGQYTQLCKVSTRKCKNEKELIKKINRAVDLGKTTHTYQNGCKIVRYHHLNFLYDDEEIMTMWSDKSRPEVRIDELDKREWWDVPGKRFKNKEKKKGFFKRVIGL